jgi:magnesium chelatase subunit I
MDQEARAPAPGIPVSVPRYVNEILAELAAELRASPHVNQRSGVSVRFSIGALEAVTASALLRAVRRGEDEVVPRAVDLWAVLPGASGRIEFDTLEEGREPEIIGRALKEAMRRVWARYLGGEDFSALLARFAEGLVVQTSDGLAARDLLAQCDLPSAGLERISNRLRIGSDSPASAASALEFALEGLHLDRRLNKDRSDTPGEWRFEGISS